MNPDWYDESKIVGVTIDEGYSGYVQDLGDGTCRFVINPLMGDGSPEFGDRVDLFYSPVQPFLRPRVGYRVYPEGVEPVGRTFGVRREPTEEEIKEHERMEELEEQRQCELIERNYEALNAPFKSMEAEDEARRELLRYEELRAWVKDQGLEIPDDLHTTKRKREEPTEEERRDTKLFLMATAINDYGDIDVTDEEVQAKAEEMRKEDAMADAILKAFDKDDDDDEA